MSDHSFLRWFKSSTQSDGHRPARMSTNPGMLSMSQDILVKGLKPYAVKHTTC